MSQARNGNNTTDESTPKLAFSPEFLECRRLFELWYAQVEAIANVAPSEPGYDAANAVIDRTYAAYTESLARFMASTGDAQQRVIELGLAHRFDSQFRLSDPGARYDTRKRAA